MKLRQIKTQIRRSYFAPEIIQTSGTDCGPACLATVLAGFGINAHFGRLRELCHTSVDGTSIDTLEELAPLFGLAAEQVIIPPEHLFSDDRLNLPCIAVTRSPRGLTHFVVIWRIWGNFVQVMDPEAGRQWITKEKLLRLLYLHRNAVSPSDWESWSTSPEFKNVFVERLAQLVGEPAANDLFSKALASPIIFHAPGYPLAALEASLRLAEQIRYKQKHLTKITFLALISSLYQRAITLGPSEILKDIPLKYWSVSGWDESDLDSPIAFSGIVLVRFSMPDQLLESPISETALGRDLLETKGELSPGTRILNLILQSDKAKLGVLTAALLVGVLGSVFEILLFRGVIDVGQNFTLPVQRFAALLTLLILVLGLLILEFPIVSELHRIGRRLEQQVRILFLRTLPGLSDGYFQSRLNSDMATRSHSLHFLRTIPLIGADIVRALTGLLITGLGICYIQPSSIGLVALIIIVTIGIGFLFQPLLTERELRQRTHGAALTRLYLDSLIGAVPIKAHGAASAIVREHQILLVEWLRAAKDLRRLVVTSDTLISAFGIVAAIVLSLRHFDQSQQFGSALLLVFWSLALPSYGQQLALSLRKYPAQRNIILRIFEPITLAERYQDEVISKKVASESDNGAGVEISFENVSSSRSGNKILHDVSLKILSGEHVAVVGSSGAGKSTLVGLLLGAELTNSGQIQIDDQTLSPEILSQLRYDTAWIDPAIQLWNDSLLENVLFGNDGIAQHDLILKGELTPLLLNLRQGLDTPLGESGRLLSAGEGQRVRVARALVRRHTRMAVLDEPFRGLPRSERLRLLAVARDRFRSATMLFVTHDILATTEFDKIIVMNEGRIIEEGIPRILAQNPDSEYARLLDLDREVIRETWSAKNWTGLRIEDGILVTSDCE